MQSVPRKFLIIITLIFLFFGLKGQSVKRHLLSPKSLFFHNKTFVYGYEELSNQLWFKCYSFNNQLTLKDSLIFSLGKNHVADFLETSVDTLHDVLNFYFQLSNQKNSVKLLRLNDSLKQKAFIENYDANHVNSLMRFANENYLYEQDMYLIKTVTDTSGKQFYLNKYQVISMTKAFEYKDVWQFPFDRKYIHHASVIFADKNIVVVYVNIFDGTKKGQWILRLNSKTGALIKGAKIGNKNDTRHFLVSGLLYDKTNKQLDLTGSIYENGVIDFKTNSGNFSNYEKKHKLFLVSIDSLGDIIGRNEMSLPLPVALPQKGKATSSYHLKVREFTKLSDGQLVIWADIFEQVKPATFNYFSSWEFKLSPNETSYQIYTSTFSVSTSAISNFIGAQQTDYYGKWLLSNISDYDIFKSKPTSNHVVIKTGIDDGKHSFYILKKTDVTLGKKTYYHVFAGKKGLEYTILLTAASGQGSNLYFFNSTQYISFLTNPENTLFELKINRVN